MTETKEAKRPAPIRVGDQFINARSGETMQVIASAPCGRRTLRVVGTARFRETFVAQLRLNLASGSIVRVS